MARAVLPGVPHHLTQRGLDRRQVFSAPADYAVYLALVLRAAERHATDLLGYCLMPNHVHWVVSPREPASLARTFGEAHGRYAAYANAKFSRSGHFWQNRFFSCGLAPTHLWTALRYVERNPVRAHLAVHPGAFPWSSAAVHTGSSPRPDWLQPEPMQSAFTTDEWAAHLELESADDSEAMLRTSTHTGRPVGEPLFIEWAESHLGRKLAPQPGGRPAKFTGALEISSKTLKTPGQSQYSLRAVPRIDF